MSIQVISSEAEVAKAANVSTDQSVVAVPSVSKKVSAQVAQKANAKKAVLDDLAKKEQEEEARQAQLAEAAAEEAVAEEVAQDEQAVEAAQTIAAAAETLDASAQEVAAVIADNPLMFAQAGAAAAGASGGAVAGISTTAIVAGVAVVGVAVAASSDSSSTAVATTPAATPDSTPSSTPATTLPAAPVATLNLVKGTEEMLGTSGDDVIGAVMSGLASARTLDAADVIDGGAGTDTLAVNMSASFTGFSSTGGLDNVEKLDLTNLTSNKSALSFALTNADAVITDVTVRANDAGFTLTGLTSGTTNFNLENADKDATYSLSYATDVLGGSADSLTLGLFDVGDAKTTTVAAQTATISTGTTGLETLNINSNGTLNRVDVSGVQSVKTVNISGSGSLVVVGSISGGTGGVASSVTTLDASSATGALDITDDNATLTSISLGSGDDQLAIVGASAGVTINGGAGTNSLLLDNFAGGSLAPTLTGFTTVTIDTVVAATTLILSSASDVETLVFNGAQAGAITMGAYTAAEAYTIQLGTAATSTTATTSTPVGVASTGAITTNDNVDLTLNYTGPTAGLAHTSAVTADAAQSLAIIVKKATSSSGAVSALAAESVTLTVDGTLTSAVTASAATSATIIVQDDGTIGTGTLKFKSAETLVINAEGAKSFTAVANSEFDAASTVTLTSANGAIDLTQGSLGKSSSSVTVDATAVYGAFTLSSGAYSAGGGSLNITGAKYHANTITVGSGRQEVVVEGGSAADTITFSEALSGSSVLLDINLGSVDTSDAIEFGANNVDFTDSTITLTGVDTIQADAATTVKFSAAQLTGKTLTLGDGAATVFTVTTATAAETFDGSSITSGATAVVNIVGTTGAETLKGGAGVQVFSGGAGADAITTGAGADKVTVTVTATADTVTDFTLGAGGDIIQFDFSDLVTGALLTLVDGNAAASAAADAIALQDATGTTTGAAGDNVFYTTTTYATSALMEVGIESGGADAITLGSATTAGDDIIIVWTDGTDTYVGTMNAVGAATTLAAGSTYTNLVTLDGTAITAINAANFAIIA